MELKDLSHEHFLEEGRKIIMQLLKKNGIYVFKPDSMAGIDKSIEKIGKLYTKKEEEGAI